MSTPKHALVVVLSNVAIDPRVRREIDWLTADGWTVDSLGLGEMPDGVVRNHFSLAPQPSWTTGRLGRGLLHALFTNRRKFRMLATDRFPTGVTDRLAAGEYDLVIFNDIDLIPWVEASDLFSRVEHVHLDLHEYFPTRLPKGSLLRFRVESYYLWTRRFIDNPVFSSRSSVASRIGELYADEFGFPPLAIIRNSPPFVDQRPSRVDPARIELLHHGIAAWERGLRDIVGAIRLLDERFHLTFMLTGRNVVHDELRQLTADLGDRVTFAPPVPMAEVATAINRYDLEIMYYRPATQNLLLALPNKLFEAVQGRLGLIVGESPMMTDIVRAENNGLVVDGWSAEALASGINSLTADAVTAMKRASDNAAPGLSAEHEKASFLAVIENPGSHSD